MYVYTGSKGTGLKFRCIIFEVDEFRPIHPSNMKLLQALIFGL
jgi:hypothetical protein